MAGLTTEDFLTELKFDAQTDENLRVQMLTWKKETLQEVNEGRGGQIVSGSGNGLSHTVSQLGMTNIQWYTALARILREIGTGRGRVTTTIAQIR